MNLISALFPFASQAAPAIAPPAIAAPQNMEAPAFVAEAAVRGPAVTTDPLAHAAHAYADALGAGFSENAAMARALEALAFSDLSAVLERKGARSCAAVDRVNRKTARKVQRVLMAIAETGEQF